MKATLLLVVCALAVSGGCARKAPAEEPDWKLQVDLVDGSRIIGKPARETLQVDLGFGNLTVPMSRIRRADFHKDGKVRFELVNEDVFTGTLGPKPFEVETIFGGVTLPINQFRAFEVRPVDVLGWLPTTRGLALYYSFDRVGDGVVTNLVGGKHTGKLHGSRFVKHGQRGGAVELTGTAKIEVPHHPELCPETLTLAAWLKPLGDQSGYHVIVGKTAASSWNGGYGLVRMPGNDKLVHFFVNGYTESVARTEIPTDRWSHIAGVCDGRTVTIYLNGKPMHSAPVRRTYAAEPGEETPDEGCAPPPSPAPATKNIRHTNVPLYIGSDARGYAWQGMIDELVLYGRALSAKEVQWLYEATRSQR